MLVMFKFLIPKGSNLPLDSFCTISTISLAVMVSSFSRCPAKSYKTLAITLGGLGGRAATAGGGGGGGARPAPLALRVWLGRALWAAGIGAAAFAPGRGAIRGVLWVAAAGTAAMLETAAGG